MWIDNAENIDFNFKRNNTLTFSAIATRSWSLALRAQTTPRWSLRTGTQHSADDLFLFCKPPVLLPFRTGGSPYSPSFVPVWCLPEQESLGSNEQPGFLLPLPCRFFGATGSHALLPHLLVSNPTGVGQRICGFITSSISNNTKGKLLMKKENISSTFCSPRAGHLRSTQRMRCCSTHVRTFTFARTVTGKPVDLRVHHWERRVADKMRTGRQTLLFYRYRLNVPCLCSDGNHQFDSHQQTSPAKNLKA